MKTNEFRVWNGMEMIYDVTVGKYGVFYVNPEKGDGLNPKDTACLTENTTKYYDGIPTMQHTGLYDVKNNPIYEHDIVGVMFANIQEKHIVVRGDRPFENTGFYLNESTSLRLPLSKNIIEMHEIIVLGNKYKNIDLLK